MMNNSANTLLEFAEQKRNAKQGWRQRLLQVFFGSRNLYQLRTAYRITREQQQHKPTIFVHQMGKVGSSTIFSSLQAQGLDRTHLLYWTHFLSPAGVALLDKLYMDGYGGWQNCPPNIKSHLSKSYVLSKKIAQWYSRQRRCKVIALVRDPVALNVSGFFQNYRWWPSSLIAQCKRKEPGYQHALLQYFLTSYAHDVPLTWFDLDLQPVFKIDIFATPFPVATGYQTYRSDFADLLLLRLEDLNRCAAAAFPPFLGVDNFAVVRANEADAKWYATTYREFTQTVALPQSYLDRIYNSKFATHFYSEEELQAFRRKWQRTGT